MPSSPARFTVCPIICWCPLWTPSNTPIVTTARPQPPGAACVPHHRCMWVSLSPRQDRSMTSVMLAAVLFDMDGTLVDSDAVVARVWTDWSKRRGVDLAEVLRVTAGRPTRDSLRELAPWMSDTERDDDAEELLAIERSELAGVVATKGALELIARLDEWRVAGRGGPRPRPLRVAPVIAPAILEAIPDHGQQPVQDRGGWFERQNYPVARGNEWTGRGRQAGRHDVARRGVRHAPPREDPARRAWRHPRPDGHRSAHHRGGEDDSAAHIRHRRHQRIS